MHPQDREYSLLAQCPPPRRLGVALARAMSKCKPGRDGERLTLLNRVYAGAAPAEQLRCRIELAELRAARRGEQLAEVV